VRPVSGKDGNPLNEIELFVDSLIGNGGVLRVGKVIKYAPDRAIVPLRDGDRIVLTEEQFERLAQAFLAELESRFVSG
jgi:hypothetical protein